MRKILHFLYYGTYLHYYLRVFLKWFCKIAKLQCSGKYRYGLALRWCQKTAFHDGVCINSNNEEFKDN